MKTLKLLVLFLSAFVFSANTIAATATGPAGPQGPAGPKGATGATGPQGPAYVAKAGDACTLKNSFIINTGILVRQPLSAGPVANQTNYLVCVDQTNQWDLSTNFQTNILYNGATNPFGPWSFMYGTQGIHNPVSYVLLNVYQSASESLYIPGYPVWVSQLPGTVPGTLTTNAKNYIGLNSNGSIQQYADIGQSIGNVIRWQSPFRGVISISGNLQMMQACGSGNNYSIFKGSQLLSSGSLVPGAAATPIALTNISVTTSDSIYFVTEPQTAYFCQEVLTNIRVNKTN